MPTKHFVIVQFSVLLFEQNTANSLLNTYCIEKQIILAVSIILQIVNLLQIVLC